MVLAVLLVVIAGVIAWQELLRTREESTASVVTVILVGYTNPPVGHGRFALVSVSNQAPYTVRLRDSWVEVEGSPYHWARTLNRSLPYKIAPVLKSRESLTVAVGEPSSESSRWRFAIASSRYTWQERLADCSLQHRVRLRVGPIVLLDRQRWLNPTNSVMSTTTWLTK